MITDARAFTKKFVKQHALIYNVADGSNPQDYSYAVYAQQRSGYNFNSQRAQFVVYDDSNGYMRAIQVINVPQGTQFNPENKDYFFVGCLRPGISNRITLTPGFYDGTDEIKNTNENFFSHFVCDKLSKL